MRNIHTPMLKKSARIGLLAFASSMALLTAQQAEAAMQESVATEAPVEDPHQVRFRADTLLIVPVLNVGKMGGERSVNAGEQATFITYNNYPSFVERGEIRIFQEGKSPDSVPIAIVEVDEDGFARWDAPEAGPRSLYYVYRVYGDGDRFDETHGEELIIVGAELARNMVRGPEADYPNFGSIDEAARRNIQLSGLMATVTGRADEGDAVRVNGQRVPVDIDGTFVAQQIVARDGGKMAMTIARGGETIHERTQEFGQAKDDWFIVGQGEITIGDSYGSGPADIVSGDPLGDGSYAAGRAAFYAKGVVGDDWRITSSVDTGEALLEDLFSNLDRKDPRQLLRRLNREQYYPTYGDDSTLVEDAPTQGRFYLRVNKDDSQLVVGNFVMSANGAELAQLDRGLFGALVDYRSTGTTSFGERDVQVTAFASDPGTVPGREEFRGTGGSLYFLNRQDISIGSERVRVEVRDRETGIVLESRELLAQQDYDFDPFQGRLTLLRPLSSTVASSGVVREGASTGNVPVLVVRYEYSPPTGSLDGYTIGGRGTAWLADTVRFGLTAQRDTVEEAEQSLFGADALVRLSAGSYVNAEYAQSEGPGFGQFNSVDGGLSFTEIANPGVAGETARAWRTEAAIDVNELLGRSGKGLALAGYYEHYDEGFSSAGRLTPAETDRWGVSADYAFATGEVSASWEELQSANAGTSRTGVLDIANRFALGLDALTAKAGLRHEDRVPGLLFNSIADGKRTDAGVELEFDPYGENWSAYGFGQVTLDRDAGRQDNDRIGAGVRIDLTESLSFAGELSGGDGGAGADFKLNHRLGDGVEAYVGYSLFADRTDTGLDSQNIFTRSNRSSLTLGARQRFSDALSVYGENRVGFGGIAPSVTRNFGIDFDPTDRLSVSGTFETGRIDDATSGSFRRTAASLSVGYVAEDVRLGTAIEIRDEEGVGGIDQTVWLVRNDMSYAVDPDWRFVGRLNFARATTSGPSLPAAEFTEAMAGLAYRPIDNERLNALVRVTYFEDLGPLGQITGSGENESPKQISHIGSIDVNYDLTERLTIGGKYGYRNGRVSLGRDSDVFVSSTAHLAVLRADYVVVKDWDVLVEGRALWSEAADDLRLGALGAIYRHIGNNVKVGVGYSLSDFSDDLTDQSYSSHGPFINLLGKF